MMGKRVEGCGGCCLERWLGASKLGALELLIGEVMRQAHCATDTCTRSAPVPACELKLRLASPLALDAFGIELRCSVEASHCIPKHKATIEASRCSSRESTELVTYSAKYNVVT